MAARWGSCAEREAFLCTRVFLRLRLPLSFHATFPFGTDGLPRLGCSRFGVRTGQGIGTLVYLENGLVSRRLTSRRSGSSFLRDSPESLLEDGLVCLCNNQNYQYSQHVNRNLTEWISVLWKHSRKRVCKFIVHARCHYSTQPANAPAVYLPNHSSKLCIWRATFSQPWRTNEETLREPFEDTKERKRKASRKFSLWTNESRHRMLHIS